MTEKKLTKKEVMQENEELKGQLAAVTGEAQRISEAAQQIQSQSAHRLMIIRELREHCEWKPATTTERPARDSTTDATRRSERGK